MVLIQFMYIDLVIADDVDVRIPLEEIAGRVMMVGLAWLVAAIGLYWFSEFGTGRLECRFLTLSSKFLYR